MKILLIISVALNLFLILLVGLFAGTMSVYQKLYGPIRKAPLKEKT
jgi:hypothetical protein